MQQLELLYLLNQLHFKELFQETERERDWRTIRGEHTNHHMPRQTIIDWIRSRVSPQSNRFRNPVVHEIASKSCCNATKT